MENFFYYENDSLKEDDNYTQSGVLNWNEYRYRKKAIQHYKTLMHIGGWTPPDLIGVCEIENIEPLKELTEKTGFKKYDYGIVHKDSPDKRGIDVGLIYRKKSIRIINKSWLKVDLSNNKRETREILHVKALNKSKKDSFHVFINHWPSRYGGKLISEPKRIKAAKTLRKKVDSLIALDSSVKILIMGDMNDTEEDESIKKVLNATTDTSINDKILYDLTPLGNNLGGTHKYHGEWNHLDHVIVSKGLLKEIKQISPSQKQFVFYSKSLLEKDEKYRGKKPKRTYIGYEYHGGMSDHLPVFIDF